MDSVYVKHPIAVAEGVTLGVGVLVGVLVGVKVIVGVIVGVGEVCSGVVC